MQEGKIHACSALAALVNYSEVRSLLERELRNTQVATLIEAVNYCRRWQCLGSC